MKKRQQQEIVVSGLTINTSDISSGEERERGGEEAEKDKRNLTDACSSFLVPDEMSLIEETSVRKVGGGGALSTSIFQVFLFFPSFFLHILMRTLCSERSPKEM